MAFGLLVRLKQPGAAPMALFTSRSSQFNNGSIALMLSGVLLARSGFEEPIAGALSRSFARGCCGAKLVLHADLRCGSSSLDVSVRRVWLGESMAVRCAHSAGGVSRSAMCGAPTRAQVGVLCTRATLLALHTETQVVTLAKELVQQEQQVGTPP